MARDLVGDPRSDARAFLGAGFSHAHPRSGVSPLPRASGDQALWFREVWARWRAGEEPSALAKRDFQRLLRDPLYSLSVRSSEKSHASFWGANRWVRQRLGGVDWGQLGTFPVEVEGDFNLEASGALTLHVGKALTLFNLGSEPQAWRLAAPGEDSTRLRLPKATFLEASGLEGFAISDRRLCLYAATRAWELDLDRPESYRLAYECRLGKLEEAAYGPRDQLVIAVSGANHAEVGLVGGEARAKLEGVPKALVVHPLLPLVAIGDQDGRIRLWNYEGSAGLERLREQGVTHRVRGLAFDPTGRLLYSIAALTGDLAGSRDERGQVQVWRASAGSSPEGTWRPARAIQLPWTPDHLSISSDGAWLLVSSRGGKVLLYAAGDRQGP